MNVSRSAQAPDMDPARVSGPERVLQPPGRSHVALNWLKRRAVWAWALRLAILAAAAALWQWYLPTVLSPISFAPLSSTASQLWAWIIDGTAEQKLWVTAQTFVIGLAIGAVVALLAGLLFYRLSRTVAAVVEPYVAAFYAMPRIVLLPILAIELGRGTLTILIFVSAGTFIYMLYSIRAQLASGDVADENAIRLMGGSSWQVFRLCLFPKLTGALLTGLVVAAPVGLGETLIAEMLAGRDGLGFLIEQASGNFQIPQLYAATVLAALVALAADLAAHRLFGAHKGATT